MILDSVKNFFLECGVEKNYVLAYSGGLDSRVLLQVCTFIRNELPISLKAVHINHGLSPNAILWSKQCENTCRELSVDFQSVTIEAKITSNKSPEEIARIKRYDAFAELLMANDILLTAHQQDDQAETVLLQLFRGAGPKGLAAMPKIKPLGKALHARPLLDVTREELKAYALKNKLQWIEDESNHNVDLTRNFLRHDIIPLLKKRWPTITQTVSRSALHCAEATQLIEEVAAKDLSVFSSNQLSLNFLLELTPARQRQVLRTWFNTLNIPIPSTVKLRQIQSDFLTAREDKSPYIQWKNVELRRYNNTLYVMKCLSDHDSHQSFIWDLKKPLILPNIGELHVVKNDSNIQKVSVRFRQGGEKCVLPGRDHHHELKKLFQCWKVPPWERDRVPLVYVDDQLIAVVAEQAVLLTEKLHFTLLRI
jgi:tRNA(Ile)-lysidine synthase